MLRRIILASTIFGGVAGGGALALAPAAHADVCASVYASVNGNAQQQQVCASQVIGQLPPPPALPSPPPLP